MTRSRPAESPRRAALAVVALSALACGACGKEGPPLPPLPRGPLAPRNVAARQVGGEVRVGFGVPAARGPKPVQQPARAELLRVVYAEGLQPPTDADTFRRRGEVVAVRELVPDSAGVRLSLVDQQLAALPDRGLGSTLRYAVRVRDRKGRSSPLVVAPDLVPLAPVAAPSGLRAEPTAVGVRLEWAPVESDGETAPEYNVYRANAGGDWSERPLNAEPIAATSYLDSGAELGSTYRYVVRVALASEPPYREGRSSAATEVVARDEFAPAAPSGLVAVQEGAVVRLFWDPNDERDVAGYRLHRRVGDGAWVTVNDAPIEQSQYLDSDVSIGMQLSYRLTAIDRASPPNESAPSAVVDVELRAEPPSAGDQPR